MGLSVQALDKSTGVELNNDTTIHWDLSTPGLRCNRISGFKFCIFPGVGERQNEVLFFTHGVLMDGNDWIKNQSYQKLRKEFDSQNRGTPTVISISHGPVWVLTSKNSRPLSGLLDAWDEKFIEKIEKSFGIENPSRRMIIGDSMGGHNAMKLFNKMPQIFDRLALLCPAQLDFSPFGEWGSFSDHMSDIDSVWPMLMAAVGLMASFYDEEMWAKESPFYFSRAFFDQSSRMQIVVTTNDMYGFTKSNRSWIEYAKEQGSTIDFHVELGTHCVPKSMKMVAEFLK